MKNQWGIIVPIFFAFTAALQAQNVHDEQAIRSFARAFMEAYNRQNVEALKTMYTDDVVCTLSGRSTPISAVEQVGESFRGRFTREDVTLLVRQDSIVWLDSENKLVDIGVYEAYGKTYVYDIPFRNQSAYRNTIVKENGKWKIAESVVNELPKENRNVNTNSSFLTFNHVALSVKDVNRSAVFYDSVLGLGEIVNRTKKEGIRWFSLGQDKELHLISGIGNRVRINKAVHFALTTPHFDQLVEVLRQKKIPFSDWPGTPNVVSIGPDGINQIFFQDPDGYWIEVNSVAQK